MDTIITNLYKKGVQENRLYKINGKTIFLDRWFRHRQTEFFTIFEKLDFDNYLIMQNINETN